MNTCPSQKSKWKGFLVVPLLVFLLLVPHALAATGINKQINFQGKVVNANGTNVTNGNYDFVFSIYTVATGGTAVWTETRTGVNQVTVTDGIFRVSLGSITALPGSIDFNTDNIYLGINFNNDGEMTPRVQFTAVPQAFNALKVAGLTVTDTTGTFTLAAAKTLTVNNTLTFAGTDSTTITFQGTDTYLGRTTTDTLTNKTIGSTGLTFSAAATDITTAANEDLTLTPNGTGNTILTSDFNTGVFVGSSSNTPAPLSVSGGIANNAAFIVNNTNNGDLITASASGTTKFRIANNGDAVLSAGITLGGTNGSSSQCLLGGASAAWGSCAAGAGSNWDIVNGVITPKLTSTLDFLLGSAATTSAKFAILNINSGTPTATISATTTGLSLSAAGTIQSLQNATLTIGGNTTGNISLSPLSGAGTVSSTGDIDLSSGKVFRVAGTSVLSSTVLGSTVTSSSLQTLGTISTGVWQGTAVGAGYGGTGVATYATGDLIYAGSVNPTSLSKLAVGNTAQVLGVSAGVPAWIDPSTIGAIWQINQGSAQLKNTTLDLLVGATASTSAKFAVLNINSGTPTASVSAGTAGGAYFSATGTHATTAKQTLTLGDANTGEIQLSPGGTLALTGRGANLIAAGDLVFGSTTRLTNTGVGTFITGTVLGSQTFTTNNIADSGALTIKSGGTSALTLDTSGAAAINLGNTNATSIALGNATTNPTLTLTGSGLTTLGGGLTFSGTVARTITGPNTGAADALVLTTAGNISGLTLNTATGSSGNSGAISIQTGTTSVSGTSGSVTIDVGAGATANGSITIGGTNASALTIGRSTVTTTVNGTLTANTLSSSGVTITGGSINSTTIGATTPSTGAFTTLSSTGATTIGNNSATVVIDGTNFDVSSVGTVTIAASQSYTGAGAVTLSSGGTSGLTFDSASGDVTVAANDGLTFAATTVGNNGSRNVTINSGTGGTTATLIVKLDTSGTVVTTDTTTLNNAVGVALNTTTVGQAVRVAINGVVTATADNAVTAGDYIGLGTTTAGRAKSLGTTYPSTAGIQVIGRALGSQATPGSTFLLMLNGLDNNVSAGAACSTCVQFATGTPDNTTNSNNLIHLQKSGVNRFVVANNGGLTINGTDSSVVRSTTAEFATGTVGSNLTNANDQLELSDGTIPNTGTGTITTVTQPTTSAVVAAGAITMTRADGKYFVLLGGTATSVYDSVAGTFTAGTALGAATGVGVQAISRPDGRYLVIHGAAGATRTIVDPIQVVANTAEAGVNFCVSAGAGSQAFRRANGRYLVVCGNGLATTAIYNPTANSWAAGPSFTVGTQSTGGLALPRPDGQVLIVNGGATATTQLYNPFGGTGDIGSFAAGPVLGTGCEINGAGSVVLKRPDGKYLVLSKANASTIYDPVANTFTCRTTNGPATALGAGAHAIPLQNGKFLVISGGATTASSIYDPTADTFTTHGTALSIVGAGAHSIMRHDGIWQILVGNSTTTTNSYDTGLPMTGTTTKYTSDDISTTSLNPTSTLKWTAQYESPYSGRTAATNTGFSTIQFFVRTAVNSGGCTTPLNSATDREILQSGDLIRPGSTDNCIRITAQFNRPIPKRIWDDRGTWIGDGSTILRLDYATPTLFDLQVDNSTVLHRNSFEFNEPNADKAAPQTETSGPVMTRVEGTTDRLYLPWGRVAEPTLVGTTGFYQGLISGAHPNLPQTTTDGTTVIARDDKQFLVMSAGAANASLYDPATQTFTAQSGVGNIPTAAIGAGAFALKLPSGKFLLVVGGALTTTNIYDPNAASGSRFVAGPTLSAAAGQGAMAIPNTDGTFTIVHGGAATTSSIFDPVRDTTGTLKAGPVSPIALNCGAWAIPRPKFNQYLVFFGVAEATAGITTTSTYDAKLKIFSPTVNSPTLPLAAGCGSFAFQRQDGLWVYMAGGGGTAGAGQTAGALYSPDSNVITALGLTFSAIQKGAHVIPRADGTFLIIAGGALTTTNIYVPWGGAFLASGGVAGAVSTAGPATATAVGDGALSFQRPDGKWVLINGGATAAATTNLIDAGWYADGQYLSEQTQVPALAANSTLEWKQTPDNFVRMEVRAAASQAALSTTGYTTVGRPGQSFFNAGGETWVQVEVNMRRDFPTFCGNLNGVYLSNGGMAYCQRNITIPTVFEYKINNGMDLLALQDNGLNILRVTSNGGIYSSATGGFFAGGADLAENYTSTEPLEKGEVVIAAGPHDVKRSTGQYQKDVLGVVSTQPGFVAGAPTEDSYPIALVGRVPVKVSTENGSIRAGDFLTSASIPGFAMKATKAGRVLGKALEDLGDTKMCPAFGMGNLASIKCGEIMMFVNLTDYMGAPVEIVMEDQKIQNTQNVGLSDSQSVSGSENQNSGFSGISDNLIVSGSPSSSEFSGISTKQQQILAFLKELKDSQDQGVNSEVFTDRVSATHEVISPQVITDILYAKKIKADSIEGLEILTDKISAHQTASSSAALTSATTQADSSIQIATTSANPQSNTIVTLGSITIETAEVKLDLTVLGKLETQGGLIVGGPAQFKNDTIFNSLAQFLSKVIFKSDVVFEGQATFNQNTAGMATIKEGDRSVKVTFSRSFSQPPIVQVSTVVPDINQDLFDEYVKKGICDKEDSLESCQGKREQRIFFENNYVITKKTGDGFIILLKENALIDRDFTWVAISVRDPKNFISVHDIPITAPSPSPTSTPTSIPTTTPTLSPTATSSAQLN